MADFTHVDPEHPPHELRTVLRWALIDRLTGRRTVGPPGPPAPRVEVPRERLVEPAGTQVIWLGHASFLLQLGTRNVLIDPILGHRLGTYKRHQGPALEISELPPIDVLLISHGHRDHLDAWTIRQLERTVEVIVPAGLGTFFTRRGFQRVCELEWWQSRESADLELTLVPARHWSRRGLGDLNASLWGGWVIDTGERRLYHAGDSAYWHGFADIGKRFPAIDLAMLPIGAYAPAWFMEHSHMNPEQAGQAFLDLGARRFLPMHWGTYMLTDEPLAEPIERLRTWWQQEEPDGQLDDVPVGGIVEL